MLHKHWLKPFGIINIDKGPDAGFARLVCPLGCEEDVLIPKPSIDRSVAADVSVALGGHPRMLELQAEVQFHRAAEERLQEHFDRRHTLVDWVKEVAELRKALTEVIGAADDLDTYALTRTCEATAVLHAAYERAVAVDPS